MQIYMCISIYMYIYIYIYIYVETRVVHAQSIHMCSRSPPVSSFEDGVPSLRIFGGPFAPGWGAMESYLNYIDEKLRKVPGPTRCLRSPREARRLAECPDSRIRFWNVW